MYLLKIFNRQLATKVKESQFGHTTSSTGFVTFLDLASVTCAASAPLTNRTGALTVKVAPEARDIYWTNVDKSEGEISLRAKYADFWLGVGIIFWSVPLAVIQAMSSAENLGK